MMSREEELLIKKKQLQENIKDINAELKQIKDTQKESEIKNKETKKIER